MEATIATAPAEVSIINDDTLEIFKSGGLTLTNNTERADKAVAIGNKILADIKAKGGKLDADLDKRCQNYLVNCSTALTEMNGERSPLTRKMDEIKSFFTSAENKVDKKKSDTPAYAIQGHRDTYAKQLADEERAKEQEELKKAAKAQEAISISGEVERRMQIGLNNLLTSSQKALHDSFYSIKHLVFDAQAMLFSEEAPQQLSRADYDDICNDIGALVYFHHNPEELRQILAPLFDSRYADYEASFNAAMSATHAQLVAQIPDRKARLDQIANADAEEKQRLLNEQEGQRKVDEVKREQEAAARLQEGEAAITAQAEEQTMDVLFAQETAIAAVHTPKPESRQAVGITVTDAQGWPLIFQTWFTHEGSLLGIDAAAKVSLGSMVKFCEARAKKYGERIESPFIAYSNTVRAVNRK